MVPQWPFYRMNPRRISKAHDNTFFSSGREQNTSQMASIVRKSKRLLWAHTSI